MRCKHVGENMAMFVMWQFVMTALMNALRSRKGLMMVIREEGTVDG